MDSLRLDIEKVWVSALPGAVAADDEDFFAVGGTSITAATLIQALRDRLSVRIPLMLLFENPMFTAFCASVEGFVAANSQPEEEQISG